MSVQLLWELHALFSEGVYTPLMEVNMSSGKKSYLTLERNIVNPRPQTGVEKLVTLLPHVQDQRPTQEQVAEAKTGGYTAEIEEVPGAIWVKGFQLSKASPWQWRILTCIGSGAPW